MSSDLLASGGEDIRVWSGDIFSDIVKQYNSPTDQISSLAWSKHNTHLASLSKTGQHITVSVADEDFTPISSDAGEEVSCLCWRDSSNKYLLLGCHDGSVKLYDRKYEKMKKTYHVHPDIPTYITLNRTGQLASSSKRGDILLQNLHTDDYNTNSSQATTSTMISNIKLQSIKCLKYSFYVQTLLASVSEDSSLVLWDTNARRSIHHFPRAHKAPATCLSFSPCNDKLVISSGLDKRIVLFDVSSKTLVRSISVDSPLSSITMHANGCQIASGTINGHILIHDLRMGQDLQNSIRAHRTSIQSLSFMNKNNQTSKRDPSLVQEKSARNTDENRVVKGQTTPRQTAIQPLTALENVNNSNMHSPRGSSSKNIYATEIADELASPRVTALKNGFKSSEHRTAPLSSQSSVEEVTDIFSPDNTDSTQDAPLTARAAIPRHLSVSDRRTSSTGSSPRSIDKGFISSPTAEAPTSAPKPPLANFPYSTPNLSISGDKEVVVNPTRTSSATVQNGLPSRVRFSHNSTTGDGLPDESADLSTVFSRQIVDELKRELKSEITSELKDMIQDVKEEIVWHVKDARLEAFVNHSKLQFNHENLTQYLHAEIERLKSEIEYLKQFV